MIMHQERSPVNLAEVAMHSRGKRQGGHISSLMETALMWDPATVEYPTPHILLALVMND